MTQSTPVEALADVTSWLVTGSDVTDLLARMVRSSAESLGADAVALLVRAPAGGLEVLAATSHRVTELELYQAQKDSGPCIDVMRTGEHLSVVGGAEMRGRWPTVGAAIVDQGFMGVHAFPLSWHGVVLGGLNVFISSEAEWDTERVLLGQAFADVSTLAVVHLPELGSRELDGRIQRALAGRVIVEQAKGVLAHQVGIAPDEAYDRLMALAAEQGATLSDTAQAVIRGAVRGETGMHDHA